MTDVTIHNISFIGKAGSDALDVIYEAVELCRVLQTHNKPYWKIVGEIDFGFTKIKVDHKSDPERVFGEYNAKVQPWKRDWTYEQQEDV